MEHAGADGISVVIPAYNAAAYLGETLASVARQTRAPLEVVVIDDGSTDDTAAIARSFDVRVISQANSGISGARNAGTEAARGGYIAYLDADDLWAPRKIEVQFAALKAYAAPAFSFTDFRTFDERGINERSGLLVHPAFRRTIKKVAQKNGRGELVIAHTGRAPVLPDCYIQPSTLLVRRADVIAVGGFDATIAVAEDYEFFLRLFKRLPAVAIVESLMLYRRHAQQETANITKFMLGDFEIARRLAAAPQRYPAADVRNKAQTEFIRYYRIGIEHARRENFDEAIVSLTKSIAARPTLRAWVALAATRASRSALGQRAFRLIRTVWKKAHKR